MVTILNGATIVYNRDGITIDSYAATGTNLVPSTTNIARQGGHTVALMSAVHPNAYACNIPDCEIGDVVEIHTDPGGDAVYFYLPVGNTLLNGQDRAAFEHYLFLRKVGLTKWSSASL